VELARRLGSGPVITAGIDFSYTLDKTHARSSPAHLAALTTHNRFKSLLNPQAAFRNGTFTTLSKSNIPVRSDPAMRNYRSLFEQEFAADPRVFDIAGTGLSLGVKTLSIEEALKLLSDPGEITQSETPALEKPMPSKLRVPPRACADRRLNHQEDAAAGIAPAGPASFIEKEKSMLEELRAILTGENTGGEGQLEALLDKADYLWAHFPDCAGAEGRRPAASDIAFLKRVRAEIDPFIALWEKSGRVVR
jgi:hypothetical protein